MTVHSPDDTSHKINSTIELPKGEDVFDIKIVSDGAIVEFFVNDTCELTANTAKQEGGYTAYLYSEGMAIFSDVKISKLIPYADI